MPTLVYKVVKCLSFYTGGAGKDGMTATAIKANTPKSTPKIHQSVEFLFLFLAIKQGQHRIKPMR